MCGPVRSANPKVLEKSAKLIEALLKVRSRENKESLTCDNYFKSQFSCNDVLPSDPGENL